MEDIFGTDDPDSITGRLLVKLSNLHQKVIDKCLSEIGLSYVQYVVLRAVYWHEFKGMSANQVALIEFTGLDKSVMSSTLRKLQALGLISRNEDKTDTRSKLVSVTKSGGIIVKKASERVSQTDTSFFDMKNRDAFNDFLRELLINNS